MILPHLQIPSTFRLPAPAVPEAELSQRLTNIRREMAASQLDIVVLTDKKNVDYFTDYQELSWDSKPRPLFAIISVNDFVVIGSLGEAPTIEMKPRIFSARYYDGYLAEAVKAISDWIGENTQGPRHIAIDYGQDMFGRGSLALIDVLNTLSVDRRVETATDAIWRVRLIKSRFEADLKRTAFEIVNSAFDQAIAQARIGMTEYELYYLMQAQTFLNGAENTDQIAMLFSKGDFAYGRTAKDRKLEEGHYVWTDFRATYGGYPADRNRIARAGEPHEWETKTYTDVRSLTIDLARQIRPGMACSDVYGIFEKMWREANLGKLYSHVSRIGHGGGLDVTEPPSLSRTDPTIIQPGMIFHIEPKLERDGAVFQFEEVVFVTDNGIEFLSELSPDTLPIIR
ncbi:Xaa-Pro peptidase family protein [Rhizobium sp. CCGE531]|uniref:M24 family metallopeptidase n=1 Tax=Rhizobium sp. CCGE531 TaxID=2364271 RepID=UPI000EA8A60D|nr:Xaa-Pro peptidase family protein [Rhizobium sp. CCGE531]AYG66068.1 aminopeptidase P family protein [Rhizobium sp. CCGE531]